MRGYDFLAGLLLSELTLAREDGRDLNAVEELARRARAAIDARDEAAQQTVYNQLTSLLVNPVIRSREPDDLESILALCDPLPAIPVTSDDAVLLDRLHGAWLGRCAGCALGKPLEVFNWNRSADKRGVRARLKLYLQAIHPSEWPVNNYIPLTSPVAAEVGEVGFHDSTRDRIAFAETDDDLRYTVLSQMVLKKRGKDFTTLQVAKQLLEFMGIFQVASAEMQAYRNLVIRYGLLRGVDDSTIDWDWVATSENPYREWIGAQIRADGWGWAVPGDARRAAQLAYRDARMSHRRNGLYGAFFSAAANAVALTCDLPTAVRAGLSVVPRQSRLRAALDWTIDACAKVDNNPDRFEELFDALDKQLGHYNWVHVIPNAAIVVAALLLGRGDFEKTITLSVMAGYDTDCNGATAGSICGAALGAKALPTKWTAPLHDTLRAAMADYDGVSIAECARKSLAIARA
jgi:ADP-ribosylglycohydrolase